MSVIAGRGAKRFPEDKNLILSLISTQGNMVRTGFPGVHAYGFDDLLYDYGVDISFWVHEHSYERTFPVYNMTVMNGTRSPYEDPGATVHIINGAAGNRYALLSL